MNTTKVRIAWPRGATTATLEDTPSTRALAARLPLKAKAQTWGEEVYFEIPVEAALERNAEQVVPPGTVCFWVEGSSLALPWGRTPISEGHQPKLVTRCNVLGKIDGDPGQLASVRPGDTITVELAP